MCLTETAILYLLPYFAFIGIVLHKKVQRLLLHLNGSFLEAHPKWVAFAYAWLLALVALYMLSSLSSLMFKKQKKGTTTKTTSPSTSPSSLSTKEKFATKEKQLRFVPVRLQID